MIEYFSKVLIKSPFFTINKALLDFQLTKTVRVCHCRKYCSVFHLFYENFRIQLVHDEVKFVEVFMRHGKSNLIKSAFLAALSKQQFEMLIGHEMFELNYLALLNELMKHLFVFNDHGKYLLYQIVILNCFLIMKDIYTSL